MNPRLFAPLLALVLSVALIWGCGSQAEAPAPGPLTMDTDEHDRWEIELVNMRIEKNEEFGLAERSPLPTDRLATFEGLEYFFPEPNMRFKTPLLTVAGTDTVVLTKRAGQEVPYLRKGKVRFRHEGQDHTLTVFGPADPKGGDYLWLPFFDATSGKESYPGGRYLDLEIDSEGNVDLDFNFAYNPLCDYNPDRYNCTLPPVENTLPFRVEAGEKTLNPEHH